MRRRCDVCATPGWSDVATESYGGCRVVVQAFGDGEAVVLRRQGSGVLRG